jgi:ParB family transcriptional regulator, chromosome partitioning protein
MNAIASPASLAVSATVKTDKTPSDKQTIFVALTDLFLSPGNVRKVEPTGIPELAQMIVSQGLLYPLIVTKHIDDHGEIRYAVEAGGRRLRALQLLAEGGLIAKDMPIECKLVSAGEALEVSLTENISQEAMHPADEFEAYYAMAQQGASVASIANKFGESEVHVQRRLKMACVAPDLFALYRKQDMTLDQLMAFAATDDKALQVSVWNSLPPHSRSAYYIKKQLFQEEVSAKDRRLKIVSLDEYKAAGGQTRVDLFSENGDELITDPALLDELVAHHLERRGEELKVEGWGWVEVRNELVQSHNLGSKFTQDRPVHREATAAEQTQMDALQTKLDALNEKLTTLELSGEDDSEEYETVSENASEVDSEIDELRDTFIDLTFPNKATQGVIVCQSLEGIGHHYGLRMKGQPVVGPDGTVSSGTTKATSEFSEKMHLNLSSQLTLALQASLIANQRVALAAAAHCFALSLLDYSASSNPVQIRLTTTKYELEKHCDSLASNKGLDKTQKALERWRQMLPDDKGTWLEWFLKQPEGASLEMIALGAALSTTAVHTGMGASQNHAKGLVKAVGLDMSQFWEATPETYLNHLPKAKIIEAVTQASSEADAEPMAKMKKAEAVTYAAAKLSGSGWLPSVLQA